MVEVAHIRAVGGGFMVEDRAFMVEDRAFMVILWRSSTVRRDSSTGVRAFMMQEAQSGIVGE
ncbi:MAG: hypothetical protein K2Q09_07515 [Phycisphaerales bacterium]|nr:hypothetical protein [Phycisphaerales bacterium]